MFSDEELDSMKHWPTIPNVTKRDYKPKVWAEITKKSDTQPPSKPETTSIIKVHGNNKKAASRDPNPKLIGKKSTLMSILAMSIKTAAA